MQSEPISISRSRAAFGLVGWLLLCFAAAALGGLASAQAQTFYAELVQPDWAPPGWVFGPVWSLLYLMMAVAAWLVWRAKGWSGARLALGLFLVQLVANALWSWLFFAWHLGALAFADILFLWVAIVATSVSFGRVRRLAGLLLWPYLAWVTFASVLCYATWKANPAILG